MLICLHNYVIYLKFYHVFLSCCHDKMFSHNLTDWTIIFEVKEKVVELFSTSLMICTCYWNLLSSFFVEQGI